MKKFLVLTLAMVAFVGSAQAQVREVRGKARERSEAEKTKANDRVFSGRSTGVKELATEIHTQNLDIRLSVIEGRRLAANLDKPENKHLLETAQKLTTLAKTNPAMKEMVQESFEMLSNLAKAVNKKPTFDLDYEFAMADERAEQGLARIVRVVVTSKAKSFDAATKENLLNGLREANLALRNPKTNQPHVEAMDALIKVVKKGATLEAYLKDLKKQCP